MVTPPTPPIPSRLPKWLGFVVSAFAAMGGLASLVLGLLILLIRFVPDTGHGEDIAGMMAIVVLLPFAVISAFLGVGAGIGGVALLTGHGRIVPTAAIALTLIG